jgi:prepilin-type N-terminal cleavage/methylation domain-containing protein
MSDTTTLYLWGGPRSVVRAAKAVAAREGPTPGRTASSGFTLIELLLVLAIVGVVVSIGMAGFRVARVKGNETAALSALTAINQAQVAFAQACGNGRYAPTLAALGAPMPTSGRGFLSPDLTTGDPVVKSGYQFVMTGTEAVDVKPACTGIMPVSGYTVTADPLIPGTTGDRYFGSNTDRVVYQDGETFAGNMPGTGAPAHGAEIK